ncbi:ATP-binding protein [Halomicronema sp. CCY15110]|uniref:hybrid sensor histidine kinase/response regulator n=1 Tax=Halomicronema sp. CCY15110 TaxID=2767773 RepID=UPI00195185DD|nr:ATP-binding protein [Halomicronema sp. CCY15110]
MRTFNSSTWEIEDDEQALILNRVGDAIALFNAERQLTLFNDKFQEMCGLSADWLGQRPRLAEILERLVAKSFWSAEQRDQVMAHCEDPTLQNQALPLQQANQTYLELLVTNTSNQGQLFILRDLTSERQSQLQLAGEVHRLRFLLGLTEKLQTSDNLEEIGKFALNYLVEAMGAAFGDVKVVSGQGKDRVAGALINQVSGQFIATYGKPAIAEMEAVLQQGVKHGEGLLWDVVDTGKPMFVGNYAAHPKSVPGFRHPGIGQLGIFPIPSADGSIIGVVTLESRTLQKLQEAPQQDMLLAACRTLGAAIERAQSQERLQRINRDLEQASRLKSEFLASMSHELRTPLNSILGFSELMLKQLPADDTRRAGHTKAIRRSGQHLLNLINDILDLSKIESGKFELDLENVSVQNLCRECLSMVQPRADRKRLLLSLELDYRIDRVNLDARRVRQIIINLLSNAIKFTPEQGKVRLSVVLAYGSQLLEDFRPDDSTVNVSTPYLCIAVEDTGIGISPEKRALLFRPFQQIDSSLTRRHEGTGLGLALTKRLAEMHGGTVSLKTDTEVGSTFCIWLPLHEMRDVAPAAAEPTVDQPASSDKTSDGKAFNGQSVLVVEDQPYNQALITEVLEMEGFTVDLVSDGHAMMATMTSELVTGKSLPGLILMDVQLPGVDGLTLIQALRQHPLWQGVPIMAVTAMAMPGDRDRCLAAGADDYITKPIDFDLLMQKTRQLTQATASA